MLAAVCYAFIALRGPGGIPSVLEKQRVLRELERENAQLTREVDAETKRVHELRNDPQVIEKEIRDKLKLTRPDETTYIIKQQP